MKANMKSRMMRIVSAALIICLLVALAVPGFAAEANQKVMDAKKGVVQIEFWYVDPEIPGMEIPVHSGTGFLINRNTVVTCQHVAEVVPAMYTAWAMLVNEVVAESFPEFNVNRSPQEVKDNCEIRISVLRDVFIKARVKQASAEMDYAILTLDEEIHNREPLALRKASTLKQTETVYALGFPGDIMDIKDMAFYNAEDVTITTGAVNKVDRFTMIIDEGDIDEKIFKDVDCVESSATITGGNSGGPLVDSNGYVVGINAAGSSVRNLAVASDQLIETLDALGISYNSDEDAAPAETEAPATEAPAETEAPATEAPATEAPAETEAPATEAPAVVDDEEEGGLSLPLILIIAAVAVVVVIIIVVIVVSSKKKKPAKAQPVAARPAPPAGGFTPATNVPLTHAPAPAADAGETTVLGGDAGETTVLTRNVNGGVLTRKRNGEKIVINAEQFVIGRERKSVNFCITDNSSISRNHIKMTVRGGVTYLTDLGAANGTYVNNVKAVARQEIALQNGDKITLADEDFIFNI